MVEINRDLRADKQINKNLLDEEAEMQPYVYGEWALLVVHAKEDMDRARLNLDKVRAERFMFHKTPAEPGEKAPTDKLCESLVTVDAEVMKAHEEFLAASKIWGHCKVAEEAMQQKRSMIKILTELHTTKYFLKEEVTVDTRENKKKTKDAAYEAVDKGVADMGKKRKKKKDVKKPKPKPEPVIDADIYEDYLDNEEEDIDNPCVACGGSGKNSKGKPCKPCGGTGEGTEPVEEEEEIYNTDYDEEMDSAPEELETLMEEEETEEVVDPPKNKRTVKKGADTKLKGQKSTKRTVKEQAAINQVEGKELQEKIKAEKPKGKCPFGYKFGEDFGLEPECDECEIDNACFKARSKD